MLSDSIKRSAGEWSELWNRFWFSAIDPTTVCVLRVLAGGMLLYTHVIWTLGLGRFFGADGWLPEEQSRFFHGSSSFAWSFFGWTESGMLFTGMHIVGLIVILLFTVGCFTRVTSILSAIFLIAFANRAGGMLFGLDQINGLLVLYLCLTDCGARLSFDRWRERRERGEGTERLVIPSVTSNIGLRLIQIHLCLIYLVAGMSKLLGESWWSGIAFWGTAANYEYQSVDLLWLAYFPFVVNFLTHLTVFFELAYPVLIWGRLTRPLMLGLALVMHLGIAICMGMMTFGLVMIIANASFVNFKDWKMFADDRI